MKKIIILFVAVAMAFAACNPYGSEVPKALVGNWINEQNGNWEYGFYEEFAICKNDFWYYQSVDGENIVLHNKGARPGADNSESIALNVKILSDSTISVNGSNYFKIIYPDYGESDDNTQWIHSQECASIYLQKMSYFPDIKEDTTDFEPFQYLREDSATVIYYNRNTAKGFTSLLERIKLSTNVHYMDINRLNNCGFYGNGASSVDSMEHYGQRMVFHVPSESVSEVDGGNLVNAWREKIYLPFIIEPNDTLMFYVSKEPLRFYPHLVEHYAMGNNARYMRERDLFYNFLVSKGVDEYNNIGVLPSLEDGEKEFEYFHDRYVNDTTLLNEFVAQSKIPISKKFIHYNKNVLLYNFASKVAQKTSVVGDFYKQNPQLFDEQEILLSRWGVSFIMEYIRELSTLSSYDADSSKHLPPNVDVYKVYCEKYPDYILCGAGRKELVNPKYVKDLGFSDECLELLRYEYFDQYKYYDATDFSTKHDYCFDDFVKQHFMSTIKSDKYRKQMDRVFANSGDSYYDEFMNKYKGKVVAMTIWDAWNEPPEQLLKEMSMLKKEMAGKDVEFVWVTEPIEKFDNKWNEVKNIFSGHFYCLEWEDYKALSNYLRFFQCRYFDDRRSMYPKNSDVIYNISQTFLIIDKDGFICDFERKEFKGIDYYRTRLDEVLKK